MRLINGLTSTTALVFCAVTFLGCPGVDGGTDAGIGDGDGDIELPPRDPPDSNFDFMSEPNAVELVDSYNQYLVRCGIFGGEFLLEVDDQYFIFDVRPTFEASHDNPDIVYDSTAGGDCAAEFRSDADCELFSTGLQDSACNDLFKGTIANGEACDAFGECADGECVDYGYDEELDQTTCGFCQDVPEPGTGQDGDICFDPDDCAEGLYCPYRDDNDENRVCTTGAVGAYCEYEDDCDEGLFCPYRDGGTSTCTAGALGDYCDYYDDCQEEYYCPYTSGGDSSCTAFGGEGDTCYDDDTGDYFDCGPDFYCNYSTNLCAAARQLGDVCYDSDTFEDFDCVEGLSCDYDSGLCVGPAGLGEPCGSINCEEDLQCDYGNTQTCVDGAGLGDSCEEIGCSADLYCDYEDTYTCLALPGEGENCEDIYQCAGDLACSYGGQDEDYTCREGRINGGACRYNDDEEEDDTGCNTGLECDYSTNTCYDTSEVGDSEGDSCPPVEGGCGAFYNNGLTCEGDWDSATCVRVNIADVGEACDIYYFYAGGGGTSICRDSLSTTYCQPNDVEDPGAGGTCATRPGAGDACGDGDYGEADCTFGTYCEIDYQEEDPVGVCVAMVQLGESCTEGDLCQYGARCTLEDDEPRCTFDYDTGEMCIETQLP